MRKHREEWKEIEKYLVEYVGQCYEIEESAEKIYIDTDFPDEFANSESRIALKGPFSKAKANASQGIPVYDEEGELLRYNIFSSRMLVRCDADGKLYLYDFIRIKKVHLNRACL